MFAERVRAAVKKLAALLATVLLGHFRRLGVRLRNQVVAAGSDRCTGRTFEVEGQRVVVEAGASIEHEPSKRPEAPAKTIELSFRIVEPQAEALMHVLVEV